MVHDFFHTENHEIFLKLSSISTNTCVIKKLWKKIWVTMWNNYLNLVNFLPFMTFTLYSNQMNRISVNRIEFYHSVVASCPVERFYRIAIEPYDTDGSCPTRASNTAYVRFDVVTGSCSQYERNCPVDTTIKLRVGSWGPDYVGSIYLTCTDNGWFPPKPKHHHDRNGKYIDN